MRRNEWLLGCQSFDDGAVLRVLGQQIVSAGELEVGEVEAGGDCAAYQRECARVINGCAKPHSGRDNGLEDLACIRIWPKQDASMLSPGMDAVHGEWGAHVEVP